MIQDVQFSDIQFLAPRMWAAPCLRELYGTNMAVHTYSPASNVKGLNYQVLWSEIDKNAKRF